MNEDRHAEGRAEEAVLPPKPKRGIRRRVRAMRERFVFNKELKLRLISAAVLVPLVLAAAWLGGVLFMALVLLAGVIVHFEWMRMVGAGDSVGLRWIGWGGLALVAAAAQTQSVLVGVLTVIAVALVCALAAWRTDLDRVARWVAIGMLYAGLAVLSVIALRRGSDGFAIIAFVFLIAWASDTMAFFVGRKVGGPKLWPKVSPSKTWSGALGGLCGGILFGALAALLLSVPLTLATLAVAGLISVAAQGGDLLESAAKRHFMVKDAGSLIPGHGGVMDRVDGLVAASLICAGAGALVAVDAPAAGLVSLMSQR